MKAALRIRHDLRPAAPPAEIVALAAKVDETPCDLWIFVRPGAKVGDVLPYSAWSIMMNQRG